MKFRGQGNAIPIALGVLAVVIAGSGTAVAVSSTTTISDPTNPARKAKVTAGGQLLTNAIPLTSTLSSTASFFNSGVTFLTSPTTASIAITKLLLSETRLNQSVAGADLTVDLVQVEVSSNLCTTTVSRPLATTALTAGDQVDLASTVPYVARPTGTTPYCLAVRSVVTNGATDATPYFPKFAFTGYVAGGTYTGAGTSATAAAPLPGKRGG